ncbi:MAG: hypothetical protein DDT23_01173 [candidate division WS2 bacterium]|nr:hypothetical protein [Candidatus Lithacetigena glycinireducens]
MKGVILNEIAKFIFAPRRWLPILLAAFFLGWANTGLISAIAINQQVGINIWDAYFLVMNNRIDLTVVLLLAIAFSVCDVVTNDYLTNYHWLVLTRRPSRFKWWLAKLIMVFSIALLALFATLFSTFLWGLIREIPLSFTPSQFAMGEFDGWRYFPVLASDASVFHLVIGMTLLAALGLGSIISCFVLLSLFLAKPFAIIGLVFFWTLLDFSLTGHVFFWSRYLSPSMKMMLMTHWPREDIFFPYLMPPLWTSVAFFVFIISAVCILGWRRIKEADF